MALQPFGPHNRQEDQSMTARILVELHKVQPILLLAMGIASAFGFKMLWPSDQIRGLESRVGSLEVSDTAQARTLKVLADAKCVELTPEQIALLTQLDCRDVFARMQDIDRIARRRAGGER